MKQSGVLLAGKSAFVSGAASGIGRAIAHVFAREGACVLVADINEVGGRTAVADIEAAGGRAIYQKVDVTRAVDHEAAVATAKAQFGKLDIACNCAGIVGEYHLETGELSESQWRRMLDVNLTGVFLAVHAQIPAMLEAGGGAIVNISSVLGAVGRERTAHYSAAKHGVIGLTKVIALEYGARNIRANVIGPGYIDTPLIPRDMPERVRRSIEADHALKRFGRAEEVAELAAWLASDKASFVTGAYYPADGGYLAK